MPVLRYLCPYCGGSNTKKASSWRGRKRSICKDCNKSYYVNTLLYVITGKPKRESGKKPKNNLKLGICDYERPACAYCGSNQTSKHGKQFGEQYYWCHDCDRYFTKKTVVREARIYKASEFNVIINGTKKCRLCLSYKSIDSFVIAPRNKCGYTGTCRQCAKEKQIQRGDYLKKYGLTVLDYKSLLLLQNNACVICGIELDTIEGQRGHIDHDHNCDVMKVRGILCHACNKILGFARDNVKILESAIFYLKKAQE